MPSRVAPAPREYDPFHMEQVTDELREAFNANSTGEVIEHAGTPSGALQCDGSDVSRVTYASLFNVIGTTFGAGDGSTTFTLPDIAGPVSGVTVWIRT